MFASLQLKISQKEPCYKIWIDAWLKLNQT